MTITLPWNTPLLAEMLLLAWHSGYHACGYLITQVKLNATLSYFSRRLSKSPKSKNSPLPYWFYLTSLALVASLLKDYPFASLEEDE